MDAWFLRVADIIKKGKISPRIKFTLKDVQELRENGWVPRNVYRVYRIGELKSLKQVRASSIVVSLSQTLSSFFLLKGVWYNSQHDSHVSERFHENNCGSHLAHGL